MKAGVGCSESIGTMAAMAPAKAAGWINSVNLTASPVSAFRSPSISFRSPFAIALIFPRKNGQG